MKKSFIALLAAAALAGCADREKAEIEESKEVQQDQLNQQMKAVDKAAEAERARIEAEQKSEKAQLEAEKKKVEAQAEADKAKAEAEKEARERR